MSAPPELKATLTLPETNFPMKANLPQNEPARLTQWEEQTYMSRFAGRGRVQPSTSCTTALPMPTAPSTSATPSTSASRTSSSSPKPWPDSTPPCPRLGLPRPAHRDQGRRETRPQKAGDGPRRRPPRLPRVRAEVLDLQRIEFIRLGVFGRWDNPYPPWTPQYEARSSRPSSTSSRRASSTRDSSPSTGASTTAPRSPKPKSSTRCTPAPASMSVTGSPVRPGAIDPALAGKGLTIIWTTTPWTLPASLAVAFHPELEYVALEGKATSTSSPKLWPTPCAKPAIWKRAKTIARFPRLATGPRYLRASVPRPDHPRRHRRLRHRRQGTGAVHTAPAHGADDFSPAARYGLSQTATS